MFIVTHPPTFEREKVFPPRKAALPRLKPLVHGFWQCLCHWRCCVLEGFYFQRTEQVKIWCCKVRWMRKYSPRKICDDRKCSMALSRTSNTNDIFLMGLTRRRQAFRYPTLSIRRSEVTFIVVPLDRKVTDATFPLFVMQCCSSRLSCFNSS